ncbi:MAG: sodium:proton antiporter [Deltaproteobacteria bacterium]|nr:sodium:proton antiporter [Deltaproteobacteria bacterium]
MSHAIELPVWTVLPFAGLLLCIAVLPLVVPHAWERNRTKGLVAALFAAPVVVYLVAAHGAAGVHQLLEKAHEYVAFIVLLGALFVVSGGIVIRGSLSGTPLLNTALLAIGGAIASFVGTTGASMLLVRPLLRANASRQRKAHIVVFFIFVVSNCGGLLTPLGDPPLFLGFLKGVPFGWTFRLWREWLLVNGLLLLLFNLWDQRVFDREERERPGSQLEEVQRHAPLRIAGQRNLVFLAAIVAIVYASGSGLGAGGAPWPPGLQEVLMAAVAIAAYLATPAAYHRENGFGFGPIIEVALLFAGIFVTMAPALLLLNQHAPSFGIREPWQFFWATGVLSSFLDNAPTYLTFAATAVGLDGVGLEGRYLAEYLALGPRAHEILAAISTGAVFMGANTYIGNGPNFMVKAIAEQSGVAMPGFFGYMAYAGAVLLPLFVLVTFVFFV